MGGLANWILSNVGAWGLQALLAIGFAGVSFAGVNTAFQGLVTYAQSAWSSLPVAVLQLASLAGVPIGLGLIFGAGAARITLWLAGNATKLIYKGH